MKPILLAVFLLLTAAARAQTCTAPGQNPSTAFPVCGTATFSQSSVPICGGKPLPYPGCRGDGLTDVNPFWYKFTCFQAGTLAFLITPANRGDDYDWELYDITNRNPDDVYTDGGLVVSNNWSGESGLTGASAAGTQTFVCGGYGKPIFSKSPQLILNHNYLLLISHFTQTQSGYSLAFGGGTAVITDPADPHLQKVEASCGGDELRLKLSKKIRCATAEAGGSEFYITPAVATVISSTGAGCGTQFDTDSLTMKLSTFLPPGAYTLHIKKGTDNNTLLDYCNRPIAETETLPFTIVPRAPTPMDSLLPVTCAPRQLRLLFKKAMQCSSIAADGTDFTINGSYPVTVTAGSGSCTNGLTKEVVVTLSQPLQTAGSFTLTLRQGSDGNTLLDECSEETLAGSALSFGVKDTVNADFTYTINYGCLKDTVTYLHDGRNGVSSWNWLLDEGQQSNTQTAVGSYAIFNQPKSVQLAVSNGFCADTSRQTVVLENYLKASFEVFEDNCPQEPVLFTSTAQGKGISHAWDFGDGGTGSGTAPTHVYAVPSRQMVYTVRYTATDSFGCSNTALKKITVYSSCYLAVPTAFTPNNDGRNDVFGVANAVKAVNLQFIVFNRWGQVVFKTTNWKQGWDGRVGGSPAPTSTFVWLLRYTDRDTKKQLQQKGTVTLIR